MPHGFVTPVLDDRIRLLCLRPYPGHKHGCPNFDKRDSCPPKASFLDRFMDLSKNVLAVWIKFNLKAQREKMKARHPSWSVRQCECLLYWQGSVHKQLRCLVNEQIGGNSLFSSENQVVTYCPEGMGVNVTETMKQIGIALEWPPEKYIHKVALIGIGQCQS